MLYFIRPNLMAEKLSEPFYRYTIFIGIWQTFNVFAPSPRQNNNHVMATVTYRDGLTELHSVPRLERVPLIEKLCKERYRKFFSDNITSHLYPFLYKDIAIYMARDLNRLENNPPEIVTLIEYEIGIPPIENSLPSSLLKEQIEVLKAEADSIPGKRKGKQADSKLLSKEEKPTNNIYDNQINPPRSNMKVLTVYRVKPEDLK